MWFITWLLYPMLFEPGCLLYSVIQIWYLAFHFVLERLVPGLILVALLLSCRRAFLLLGVRGSRLRGVLVQSESQHFLICNFKYYFDFSLGRVGIHGLVVGLVGRVVVLLVLVGLRTACESVTYE